MDGTDAATAIRKWESGQPERDGQKPDNRLNRVPIVAITASVLESDRETCLAAGMDDFINKPINPAQIRTTLEKWCPRGVFGVSAP
jgi:CheY-like chemotaxis protein